MNPALAAAPKNIWNAVYIPYNLRKRTLSFTLDLDELSNQVPVLIEQKKFTEAEEVCQKLKAQYPEQIDGLRKYAELFEAQEEKEEDRERIVRRIFESKVVQLVKEKATIVEKEVKKKNKDKDEEPATEEPTVGETTVVEKKNGIAGSIVVNR